MEHNSPQSNLYIALILWGCSSPVFAQDAPLPLTEEIQTAAENHAESISDQATSGGPSTRSSFGFFDPEIQILGSDDDKSISFSISSGSSHPIDVIGPNYQFATDRFKLSGEVAIDRSSGEESPFRFGSIGGNGTKLTLGYSRFISGFRYDSQVQSEIDSLVDRASYACAIKVVGKWAVERPMTESRRNIQNAYLEQLQLVRNSGVAGSVSYFIDQVTPQDSFKELANEVFSKCAPGGGTLGNSNALISEYVSLEAAQGYGRTFSDGKSIKFFGVDGSVAREKFDFIDQANLSETSLTKTTYEAAVFAGLIGSNASWSLRGKLSISQKYKAMEEKEFCDPAVAAPEVRCIMGAEGPPKASRSGFLSIEARSFFGKDNAYAIAPSITFDIEEEEFAIDVPIYLSKKVDGKLNAGIQLGYKSENDDFAAGFFVGIPFSTWFSN